MASDAGEQIADLIRAGVPLDRIRRLADGTWAYVAPCPTEWRLSVSS